MKKTIDPYRKKYSIPIPYFKSTSRALRSIFPASQRTTLNISFVNIYNIRG